MPHKSKKEKNQQICVFWVVKKRTRRKLRCRQLSSSVHCRRGGWREKRLRFFIRFFSLGLAGGGGGGARSVENRTRHRWKWKFLAHSKENESYRVLHTYRTTAVAQNGGGLAYFFRLPSWRKGCIFSDLFQPLPLSLTPLVVVVVGVGVGVCCIAQKALASPSPSPHIAHRTFFLRGPSPQPPLLYFLSFFCFFCCFVQSDCDRQWTKTGLDFEVLMFVYCLVEIYLSREAFASTNQRAAPIRKRHQSESEFWFRPAKPHWNRLNWI